MKTESAEQEVRVYAFRLWQEAGCPEGQEEVFWTKAKDILSTQQDDESVDAASEQSFPASDPAVHM